MQCLLHSAQSVANTQHCCLQCSGCVYCRNKKQLQCLLYHYIDYNTFAVLSPLQFTTQCLLYHYIDYNTFAVLSPLQITRQHNCAWQGTALCICVCCCYKPESMLVMCLLLISQGYTAVMSVALQSQHTLMSQLFYTRPTRAAVLYTQRHPLKGFGPLPGPFFWSFVPTSPPIMPNMLSLFLATSSVLPSTATGTMTGGKAHHHSWQLSPPSRAGWAGEQGRSCAGARAQRCCSLYQKKCWGCNGACSVVQGSRGAGGAGRREAVLLTSLLRPRLRYAQCSVAAAGLEPWTTRCQDELDP